MIVITRLDGKCYTLNAEIIETIESTPDTVITLTTGRKLVVKECVDDIIDKTIQYKRKIFFQYAKDDNRNGV